MKTILSILALISIAAAEYQAVYFYSGTGCSSSDLISASISESSSCMTVSCIDDDEYTTGVNSYKLGCQSTLSFPYEGVVYNYYNSYNCTDGISSIVWYKNDYCSGTSSFHCDSESGNVTLYSWYESGCTGESYNYTYESDQCIGYSDLSCSTVSIPSSGSSTSGSSSEASYKYMTTYLYADSSCSDSGLMAAMAYEVDGQCTTMPCQSSQVVIPGISYMKVACENSFSKFPVKGMLVQPYDDDQCATNPDYEMVMWYKNDLCLMGMNVVCDESTDTFSAKNWSNTDCSGTTLDTVTINSGSCYEGAVVTCLYETGTNSGSGNDSSSSSVSPSKQFFLALFSVLLFIFFKIK